MICLSCRRGIHTPCRGGTWCDCAHRPRGTAIQRPPGDPGPWEAPPQPSALPAPEPDDDARPIETVPLGAYTRTRAGVHAPEPDDDDDGPAITPEATEAAAAEHVRLRDLALLAPDNRTNICPNCRLADLADQHGRTADAQIWHGSCTHPTCRCTHTTRASLTQTSEVTQET